MFAATRRWFRRKRTPIAVGVGVVGAGYVVAQYLLSKLNDARQRMSSERIARENLRRRFEQNQEDCTFTVLALLPTATGHILEAMDTEKITYEIQHMKGPAQSVKSFGSTSPPSLPETNATDDDGRSMVSMQSESGVHASQTALPSAASLAPVTQAPRDAAQQQRAARKSKRQLWADLTISAVTRSYTLLYTLTLLTMLTRIQLNLLGRRSYLSSVVSLATRSAQAGISLENNDDDNAGQAYGSDFEVNRKYLTFSWWLLNRGWVDIMQRVETAVRQVFGNLSPRDSLTLDAFAQLTASTRGIVEGSAPGTQWLPYLLPPQHMEEFVLRESGVLEDDEQTWQDATSEHLALSGPDSAASLRRLLDETADLIESPAFKQVLTSLLDAGFRVLLEKKLAPEVFAMPDPAQAIQNQAASFLELAPPTSTLPCVNRAVPLPKILSVLTRQACAIGNGMPNEYLQEMETVRDLEGFAAVVYSSNWEAEIARGGDAGTDAGDERHAAVGLVTSAAQVTPSGPSQESNRRQTQPSEAGAGSVAMVDLVGSFEGAWERAAGGAAGGDLGNKR